MKIKLLSIIILLVLLSLVGSTFGCTTTPTTPEVKPSPMPTPVTSPTTVKPIVLKFSTHTPPENSINALMHIPWMDAIEQRSGGRIKFERYYAESLGKSAENSEMVRTGIADVVYTLQSYVPGRFPLTSVNELPFTFQNTIDSSKAAWALFQKDRSLFKEYDDYHTLFIGTTPPYQIFTSQPVRTLNDLKGKKIRAPGGYTTKGLEALGAVPVVMAAGEVYTSVQRGVIDGFMFTYAPSIDWKLNEVTKNITDCGFTAATTVWFMNKTTWASLTPDLQKIVDDATEQYIRKGWGEMMDAQEKKAIDSYAKTKVERIILSPAELKQWRDAAAPVWDGWLKDMNAKNLPAQQILDDFKSLLPK